VPQRGKSKTSTTKIKKNLSQINDIRIMSSSGELRKTRCNTRKDEAFEGKNDSSDFT
jgi:hypothetical protein